MIRTLAGLLVASSLVGSTLPANRPAADRAFLGVALTPVPEALSKSQDLEGGALVQEVIPDSPARRAGLLKNDVISRIDGDPCQGPADVTRILASREPDQEVRLTILRDGESLELVARLDRFHTVEEEKSETSPGFLGVRFEALPPSLGYHLSLESGQGVMVTHVLEGSAAEKAGLRVHDVIVGLDSRPDAAEDGGVQLTPVNPSSFPRGLAGLPAGQGVKLEVIQGGQRKTISVTLGERPHFRPPAPGSSSRLEVLPPEEGGRRFFQPPRFRGRLKLFGDDGEDTVFELPRWQAGEADLGELLKRHFDSRFGSKGEGLPDPLQGNIDEFRERIEKIVREFEERIEKSGPRGLVPGTPAPPVHVESHHSTSRVMSVAEGDLRITVKDRDGEVRVSVVQAGKSLADGIAVEKIDTLPEEIRDRVRAVLQKLDGVPGLPGKKSSDPGADPGASAEKKAGKAPVKI